MSEPNSVFTGDPQGSTLGPLLFLIHFNDVDKSLRHSNDKIIAYADDSVIFTSSKGLDAIQHNLSEDTIASPLGSEITNLLKKRKN